MATCLLGFGSNLGNREEILRAAFAEINAIPGGRVALESKLYRTRSVGGPANQPEFVNAAAIIETQMEPLELLVELQRIEAYHGRQRLKRWAARTLDIDLLLYEDCVIDSAQLRVPHPRMSFRRFVLEPSAEIAAEMVHPTIGWTVAQLFTHLNSPSSLLAVVAQDSDLRCELASALTDRYGARLIDSQTVSRAAALSPEQTTTWILVLTDSTGETSPSAAANKPKLSILIDTNSTAGTSTVLSEYGRGPTLRIRSSDWKTVCTDVFAAVEAVWSHLGPKSE